MSANQIKTELEKFKHMIPMFNSKTSDPITPLDLHQLLKHLITDEDD